MSLTLTFTTSTGGTAVDKTWSTVCISIGTNSDLQAVLRSNQQTGLSSGTKFLDVGKTVLEKSVAEVVLETSLSMKALIKNECMLEVVDNGGKSALQVRWLVLITRDKTKK